MSNENNQDYGAYIEGIIATAIKIPGVKVNRNEFLAKVFEKEDVDINNILEEGPINAGCSEKMLDRLASKLIIVRTSESSVASFAAGIPGGLAMAATIPADTLQYFAMSLRLSQELTYLYGATDLWVNGEVDTEEVKDKLILYCGVMFGISGASAGVRLLCNEQSNVALNKIPQDELTKTFWYSIAKQIAKFIGVKITKDTAAKGITKAIPVIGGIFSGGLTFVTMKSMGNRLQETLSEACFHYTDVKEAADFEEVDKMSRDYEEEDNFEEKNFEEDIVEQDDNVKGDDIFTKIEKLAKLRDMGAISEEEFTQKKRELLSLI